jgi:hypothetical protein
MAELNTQHRLISLRWQNTRALVSYRRQVSDNQRRQILSQLASNRYQQRRRSQFYQK